MVFAIYILSGLCSLGMIVHCIKTGRNSIWVYALVMLMSMPFVGAAVYAGVEILPDLLRSRTSQRAMRGIRKTLDPEGDLRRVLIALRRRMTLRPVQVGQLQRAVTRSQRLDATTHRFRDRHTGDGCCGWGE